MYVKDDEAMLGLEKDSLGRKRGGQDAGWDDGRRRGKLSNHSR